MELKQYFTTWDIKRNKLIKNYNFKTEVEETKTYYYTTYEKFCGVNKVDCKEVRCKKKDLDILKVEIPSDSSPVDHPYLKLSIYSIDKEYTSKDLFNLFLETYGKVEVE